MILLHVAGLHSTVECVRTKRRNSIPGMLAFGFLNRYEVVFDKNAQSVTGVPPGEVCIISNITRTECQVRIQNAEDGEVCRHHPIHLAMHNLPVHRLPHYMTGLYGGSYATAIHTLRYRELDISRWGLDMVLSHDVGVNVRLLGEKIRVDACLQQTPTFWPQNRMFTNALNRVKSPGPNAAQRRRKRCTGLDWNPGRCKRFELTATERTCTENPSRDPNGGGQCVAV